MDDRRLQRFLDRGEVRVLLADIVFQIGCRIEATYPIREASGGFYNPTWGFFVRPTKSLRDLMSVRGCFLVIVAEEIDDLFLHQRSIVNEVESALKEAADSDIPLCEDFAVIITRDPDTQELAQQLNEEPLVSLIGFAMQELEAKEFLWRVRSQLFVRDLYWRTDAISNPRHFYGRQSILKQLSELLISSRTHVGLFGLRKVGKTSCLYQLFELLRRRRQVLLCHLDVQRIDSVSQTADYFLWSVGEEVASALRRIRVPGLQMFGKYPMFHHMENRDADIIPELFHHDLRLILEQVQHQLVIAFDEIELMSPRRRGSSWNGEFGKAWRLLRGIEQEFPGRVSFLITGTNPQIVETGRFGDEHDNPIYNYFRKLYLPPFAVGEVSILLNQIGRQLGLLWETEAIEYVHQLTGGHPLLVRLCGSVIHRENLPRNENVSVTSNFVKNCVSSLIVEASPHLSQMVDVLSDDYEDEFMLLQYLADGRLDEFQEMARVFPEDIAHLEGYGLIGFSASYSNIKGELLQSWLQRRRSRTSAQRTREREKSLYYPGEKISENYEVVSRLGHRGGFAEVYLCRDVRTEEQVAIKVLRNGSLAALQRETDVLEQVASPGIVCMITSGRSAEGYAYLVMEYLEGPTLRENCSRVARLSPEATRAIGIDLLRVLETLHPNITEVNYLIAKSKGQSLTQEELSSLQRARHGYVHRDIKPENVVIVKDRGPVLIDFNITSRAGDPTITVSATPGYLPSEFHGRWEPDVDLYQLGLTLLQCSLGIQYNGENLEDLRSLAIQELPALLAHVLTKLCAPTREQRFGCAGEAVSALQRS